MWQQKKVEYTEKAGSAALIQMSVQGEKKNADMFQIIQAKY